MLTWKHSAAKTTILPLALIYSRLTPSPRDYNAANASRRDTATCIRDCLSRAAPHSISHCFEKSLLELSGR